MNKLIILLFSILIISCEPSKVPINTQGYPIDTSYVFNSSSDFIMFDGVVTKSIINGKEILLIKRFYWKIIFT